MSVVGHRTFDLTKSIVMRQKSGFHMVFQIVLRSAIWKPGIMCPRSLRGYAWYQQICTDQGIYTAKQEQD